MINTPSPEYIQLTRDQESEALHDAQFFLESLGVIGYIKSFRRVIEVNILMGFVIGVSADRMLYGENLACEVPDRLRDTLSSLSAHRYLNEEPEKL